VKVVACRVRRDYSDGIVENKGILKDGKSYFIVETNLRPSKTEFYPKHERKAPRVGPLTLEQAKAQLQVSAVSS
jgi:hypothetical protein